MWLDEEAPIRKRDLVLTKPFVNAPGMLGFAPNPHTMPFLENLGAFVTHPISRLPRHPANNRCCLPFPGGFLLHTGWPNSGISRTIARHKHAWADAPLPVIVNLLVESPPELAKMVHQLERLENVMGIELGIPPETNANMLREFIAAAAGELPILVGLEPQQLPDLLTTLITLQPEAVHLRPSRGTLPDAEGNLVSGRLYGPAFFPLTLTAAKSVSDSGLSVIAGCGVFRHEQAQSLLEIGAFAVSLHTALWGVDSLRFFG